MKKFRFKLDRVLDHKQHVEDEKKGELARAEQLRREAEQALAALVNTRESWSGKLKCMQEGGSGGMDVREVRLCYDHLETLEREIVKQQHALRGLTLQADAAREKLIAARREREALDRLKDKGLRSHQAKVNRLEQMNDDEVGLNIFNRKENGHGA